ncbi:MAG: hypothetical protein WC554_14980 [Clostridia bacterium]
MKARTVNFQRGLDPKDAMRIGMTDERKLNYVVSVLNKYGIEAKWDKDGDTYDIFKQTSANHRLVYAYYANGKFETWEESAGNLTTDVEDVVIRIFKAIYPHINKTIKETEAELDKLNKIKEYLKK